jgi:hypothetical protein
MNRSMKVKPNHNTILIALAVLMVLGMFMLNTGGATYAQDSTPSPTTPDPEFYGEIVDLDPQQVRLGKGSLVLDVVLPEGYKFADLAPFRLTVYGTRQVNIREVDNNFTQLEPEMPVSIPLRLLRRGDTTLTFDAAIFYCEAVKEELCFPLNVRFNVPLDIRTTHTEREIRVQYAVQPPVLP